MAMMEVDMAEYVKREELAGYVRRTEIEAEMANVAGKKVIAAILFCLGLKPLRTQRSAVACDVQGSLPRLVWPQMSSRYGELSVPLFGV